MNYFWFDSSGLVKRYIPETGSQLIDHLFGQTSARRLMCLLESVGEVISVFVRSRNAKVITATASRRALLRFDVEITSCIDVRKIHPSEPEIAESWQLIEKHSINSTDAIILKCALSKAAELKAVGNNLVLVSSDARLVRAAKTEGLSTFNPESDDQAALDSLIN